MDIGPPEVIIVLLIILLLFGGAKIPELARSLGNAKREFEKGARDGPTTSDDSNGTSA